MDKQGFIDYFITDSMEDPFPFNFIVMGMKFSLLLWAVLLLGAAILFLLVAPFTIFYWIIRAVIWHIPIP